MTMANYTAMTSNELVSAFMAGSADVKAAITKEMTRRDTLLSGAAASLQAYFTHKGGIYCQNPAWSAVSTEGNDYCPAINFANIAQVRDVITAGSVTNLALQKLCDMSSDDVAKAVEAHKQKKTDQAIEQRGKLVKKITAGKAKAEDLAEFDEKNPGIAALCAA